MMLASNLAAESTGGPVLALAAADIGAPLAMLERTQIPKVVIDTARALLQLTDGNAKVQWAKAVDKKNELLLETTAMGGMRYARLSMHLDLPVAHVSPCMLDMSIPGREKWNQMAEKVDVIRSETHGNVQDTICTIHFKMPGVAKLIKSIPTSITVRLAIEKDLPEPGHLTYVMIGWDVKADAPDNGPMAMMRVATIEPAGEGGSRIQTIDKQMQAVPEWISNMWVSNTMAKQVKTVRAGPRGRRAARRDRAPEASCADRRARRSLTEARGRARPVRRRTSCATKSTWGSSRRDRGAQVLCARAALRVACTPRQPGRFNFQNLRLAYSSARPLCRV